MDTNGQNDNTVRFLVMPYDILGIDELNLTDKFVLARIAGFKKFFEASQTTAEFLGLSKIQVERAKRKLVKLGYVIELADTGRGKVYRCQDFFRIVEKIDRQNARPNQNVRPDMTKMSDLTAPKCQTENKVRIKRECKGDENVAGGVENSKKEYGRADINALVELWESETGVSIKGQQNERRQLYNLLRKYGLEGTKTLLRRVGATRRSRDRYAPQIAVPSDLTGKYSKLPRMQIWEERNNASRPFGQPANTTLAAIKGNDGWNDSAWDEPSEDERAKVHEMFKKARGNLFKN